MTRPTAIGEDNANRLEVSISLTAEGGRIFSISRNRNVLVAGVVNSDREAPVMLFSERG